MASYTYKTPPFRPRGPHEENARKVKVTDVARYIRRNNQLEPISIDELVVAPSGWSAARCLDGHFLPEPYPGLGHGLFECECGARSDGKRFAICYSSLELLLNADHARQAIWYHVSRSPDLFVNDEDHLMHWGEFDTVMHHYMRKDGSPGGAVRYLYSATLTPGTEVAPTVLVENENVDDHRGLASSYETSGPTRYLNTQERHGSISLVARKSDFTVYKAYDLFRQDESVIKLP